MTRSMMRTKRPRGIALGAAAALASVALYAQPAGACSCKPPPGPTVALAGADAVFEGRAGGATARPNQGLSMGSVTVPFTVLRAWKGAPGSGPLTITTSGSSSSCGYHFVAGETYLVYAYRDSNGALTTSICSRTRRSADGADDFAAFGAPGGAGSSSPPSTTAPGTTGAPPGNPPAPSTAGSAGGTTDGAPSPPAGGPASGGDAALLGGPAPKDDPPTTAPPPAPSSGGCAACALPSGALDGDAPAFAGLLGLAALLRRIAGRRR